jgi:hypothetical protein
MIVLGLGLIIFAITTGTVDSGSYPEPDVSVVLDLFSDLVHRSEMLYKNIQHHNWNFLLLLNC